jgi:lipoprotein NlpD
MNLFRFLPMRGSNNSSPAVLAGGRLAGRMACLLLLTSIPALSVYSGAAAEAPDYANGWYHWASGSETIQSIAELYGRTPSLVAEINRAAPGDTPPSGKAIYIPPVEDRAALVEILNRINQNPASVPTSPPRVAPSVRAFTPNPRLSVSPPQSAPVNSDARPPEASGRAPAARGATGFAWPVEGRVLREFNESGAAFYRGIAISASERSPVRAARDGEVLFAGELKGYGRVVIIRHDGGLMSVYGFTDQVLVKEKQRVRMGQEIAMAGRPSASSEPQVFFQIRRNDRPINPRAVLP